MVKTYFKTAWRNLLKNKLHSGINITGMVIGFTIGLLVLLIVYNMIGFDNFHQNRKKLFQVYNEYYKAEKTETSIVFGFPAAEVYKAEVPAIEKTTRYLYGGNNAWYGEKEIDLPVMLVDEDFLSMFTFPVVKGNAVHPLKNLTDIVLTEAAAKKVFGTENPIGKTIKSSSGGQLLLLTVSAVVKNFPAASSLKFDALARIENRNDYPENKNNWNNQHHSVFVQLKDNATPEQARAQIRAVNKIHLADWYESLKKEGAKTDPYGDVFASKLLPITAIHYTPEITGDGAKNAEIFTVMLIGLLIILIASFNFININLANAFTRSKEIAIRKCLGAVKERLLAQLWSESFLLCSISYLISMGFLYIIAHSMSSIPDINFSLKEGVGDIKFLLLSVALLLFVSLLAGGYPSWIIARFGVIETLKGKVKLNRKSLLRNGLIVLQFTIACVMISCTFIIYKQFRHLQNADLGINKDHVISIPIYNAQKGKDIVKSLRMRLAPNPAIVSVTGSNINIGRGLDNSSSKSSSGFNYKDKKISTNIAAVDYDYLKTFNIKPIDGRDFDKAFINDSLFNVIFTESAARQFGENNITGKELLIDSAAPKWNVIGVIPDYHLYSLHEKAEPITLVLSRTEQVNYCFIKTNPQNPMATMDAIKKEMAALEPGREFRGSFIDDNINNLYKQEQMMSLLFSIAACISILLSCMGLLAMVLLIIQQRVKEIGVRKILGASVQHISAIISREFVMLVLIAVCIATPIAWVLMDKWLQNFPYRITIQWWMFLLVALTALVVAVCTIGINTVKAARQNPVKSLRTE